MPDMAGKGDRWIVTHGTVAAVHGVTRLQVYVPTQQLGGIYVHVLVQPFDMRSLPWYLM